MSATCVSNHVSVDDDWNYVHNLMYAIANLMEQGRLEDANALSDHLARARGELRPRFTSGAHATRSPASAGDCPVALRVGDWTAVLAMLDDANLPDTDKTANLRFLRASCATLLRECRPSGAATLRRRRWPLLKWIAGLWRQGQDAQTTAAAKAKVDADKAKSTATATKPDASTQAPVTLSTRC